MNWVKYWPFAMLFIVVLVILAFILMKHQSNITSAQNVDMGMSTLNVGQARESLSATMNKDALEANLLLHIAEEQKEHGNDTRISYVFLDKDGNVTSDLDDVESVQYQVELLNKKGDVISVTRERIQIHSLMDGED